MSSSSRPRLGRILVAESDPHLAAEMERHLLSRGYGVAVVDNGADLLEEAARVRPAVVVVDLDVPGPGGVALCRRLRTDLATATAAVVVLTGGAGLDDPGSLLAAGADDYVTKPFGPLELLARVDVARRRERQRRSVSPLTGLPGHFEVLAQLERLVGEDPQRFALLHVDLDDFAAYNRRHGVPAGDEAISVTADVLRSAVERITTEPRLVGHVGGDDFVVLVGPDGADDVAAEVVDRFAAAAALNERDGSRGFAALRLGDAIQRVPLVSVSVGVATSAHRRFASASEVTTVAAEMLRAAKARPGSAWYVDRRWAAAEGGHSVHRGPRHVAVRAAHGRDYLSTAEVAAILHVSVRSVARWAAEGRLPHLVTLGGHRRFPRAAIEQSLQQL